MGFKSGDGSVTVADETKHTRTPGHVHDNALCRPSVCGHDLPYVITSSAQTSCNGRPIQTPRLLTSASVHVKFVYRVVNHTLWPTSQFYWRLWYMYMYGKWSIP